MDERRMVPPLRSEQRSHSMAAAQREIKDLVAPLQHRGFYGSVPMELELQDGIVMVVRSKGPEETRKIRPAA